MRGLSSARDVIARHGSSDTHGSRYMNLRPTSVESIAVIGFFTLGVLLRTMHLDREAVEHFDEGIYASALWYDGQSQQPYPARHLYSPPLLSTMMEGVNWIPGIGKYSPFLPSVFLGIATIVGLWLLARNWFGKPAGVFMAGIVALNDFHIIYSRMALTDVACLFWIIASVGLGTYAVAHSSFKSAIAAGFVCGLAWWTKYTGWLPLAILCSGSGLWWMWEGRRSQSLVRIVSILITIIVVAGATFAPWWWKLQEVGGYQAVAATHASYVTGWSHWTKNLAQQLSSQLLLDGVTGQLSLGLALFAAGLLRWTSGRSTWNAAPGGSRSPTPISLPPLSILLRFSAAAAALTVISFRIKAPLLLLCIGIAGLSGIHLWPVLQRSFVRRQQNDLSPTTPGALPLGPDDLACAPVMSPNLGLCTTLTWFIGMLVTTPMYMPFSRLFFPLLAAIWMAAAGGVAWWLESNLSVARRCVGTGETIPKPGWGQRLVSTMLAAAVLSSFFRFDENHKLERVPNAELLMTSLFSDRRSIVMAADEIADSCVADLARENATAAPDSAATNEIDLNHLTPRALIAAKAEAKLRVAQSDNQAASITPEERSRVKLIVYAYGEPALSLHLNHAGLLVLPVSHLNLRDHGDIAPRVPTFIVFGPNAKRTSGFWEELMLRSDHFRQVARIEYAPGIVTLYDLFSPKWISEHPEAELQTLEVYRVE